MIVLKVDCTLVMNYINQLDSYYTPVTTNIPTNSELYEEAFEVFRKFDANTSA